ncbi:N-acetylmuramoyl-L-alanine amidase [Anaerotaenia torta]|uniref:N-acetylmuramoyl-L-alanine amidase family protein n=1 Tax=Anaerotaenia torta TaxID=433293 RepID=UPI003D1DAA76
MMRRNYKLLTAFGAVLLLLLSLSLSACLKKQEPAEMTALMAKAATTPTPTASPTKKQQDSSSYEKKDSSSRPDNASPKKSDKKQKEEPASEEEKEPKKRMIAIDAGHQGKGNSKKEPVGPGAKTKKAKVTSGTQGVATKVPEYKLTLVIALKVKEELINRGYDVFMIRETHDVDISNKERADMANESGADLFIRIHADGSENSSVSGTSTLYPSKDNPYVSHLSEDSYALSKAIVDSMCKLTKAKNRGAIARDDLSGINWCTIPVSVIEMGYMSNKKEDTLMQEEEYQDKLVQGICNGIDAYYEGKNRD